MANIDFTSFSAAKSTFEANPNLCILFKFLAVETWKRLEFSYIKPYVKVFETTLTQNIAFNINAYKAVYPRLPIRVLEAEDEYTNGNDLELVINYPSGSFYTPIQAKKIYRNGKYDAMEHGNQIEKLIEYAENNYGYPLYLLYNYVDDDQIDERYGCSVVDAYYLSDNYYNARIGTSKGIIVAKWKIPDFYDLHPSNAIAWQDLVCGNKRDLAIKLMGLMSEYRKRDITIDRILNPKEKPFLGFIPTDWIDYTNWIDIREKQTFVNKNMPDYNVEKTAPTEKISSKKLDDQHQKESYFNPKYRIVIDYDR